MHSWIWCTKILSWLVTKVAQKKNREEFHEMAKMMYASDKLERENERCLYENDDILVEHVVMEFPDDTKEAVMAVWTKKGGKLVKVESGAEPLK